MIGFLTLLPVMSAYGQGASVVKATIPFQFKVGNHVFPAGEYKFTLDNRLRNFTILGLGKAGGFVPVLTRIAGALHATPQDVDIVFDQEGDTYFLSEIWLPGLDGFTLRVSKEKHEHRIVTVPR